MSPSARAERQGFASMHVCNTCFLDASSLLLWLSITLVEYTSTKYGSMVTRVFAATYNIALKSITPFTNHSFSPLTDVGSFGFGRPYFV